MTIDPLQQILLKHKWPIRIKEPKTSIVEIEKVLGFMLPSDYKYFIQTYSGYDKFIEKQFIQLWDAGEIIKQNQNYNITNTLPQTVGIGSNGAGEFIAIEKIDKVNYRIVLSPFIELEKQYHIEIGNSFTDFLVKLDNGHEWFQRT